MITKYKTEISEENLISYLIKFKGKVFKIIPIRQELNPTLTKYIESLISELLGVDSILSIPIGIELVANLQYILELGSFQDIKRQVFKSLDILEKMIVLLEVEANE